MTAFLVHIICNICENEYFRHENSGISNKNGNFEPKMWKFNEKGFSVIFEKFFEKSEHLMELS